MENKKRVFTVLCIDGGGVRGMVPARILEEIEARTGQPAAALFDMVGGPSTGSIIAAGLSVPDPADPTKPKHTAKEMKEFYHRECAKIFPHKSFKSLRQLSNGALYNPKPLEDALLAAYGDAKVRDSLISLLIPATDIKNFAPVWINHIKGEKDTSVEGWSSMLLRDAIRASTTAPTYFPSKYYTTTPNEDMPNITHRHALIDGGFYSGTIMPRLLAEARRVAPPDAEIVMVHVGTGSADNSLSPEEYNKLGPLGFISKSKGSILMSLVVSLAVRDSSNLIENELGQNFVNIDGKISLDKMPDTPSTSLDDGSPENMKKLEKFAEEIIAENEEAFDRLCAILKRRAEAQAEYNSSHTALEALNALLKAEKTPKSLTTLFEKICEFKNGAEIYSKAATPAATDEALKLLARRLCNADHETLCAVYKAQMEALTKSTSLKEKFKHVADDVRGFLKKMTSRDMPKDTPPEPPAGNDNQPPQEPKKKFFGWPGGKKP